MMLSCVHSGTKVDDWPFPSNVREFINGLMRPWAVRRVKKEVKITTADDTEICTTTETLQVNPIIVVLALVAVAGTGVLGVFANNRMNA